MDGSKSTAPPDPWSKSKGMNPATVPGTRIEKMSVFRATMNDLLCLDIAGHYLEMHQAVVVSGVGTTP